MLLDSSSEVSSIMNVEAAASEAEVEVATEAEVVW
jgi:hypothetical protein